MHTMYTIICTINANFRMAQIPRSLVATNCHQSAIPIAEYVIANVFEIVVNVRAQDEAIRNCTWRSKAPGNTCSSVQDLPRHRQISDNNLTLGILGYGSIGEQVAKRAAAVGLRVIGTTLNPPASPPEPLAWLGTDKDNARLMAESDFVVIGCPLSNSTKGIVNSSLLKQMKNNAWIINIARAAIIDETALWNALQPPRPLIGGAVLDVWWHDHLPKGGTGPQAWPSQYRFDSLPNVIMSPHSSSLTPQARQYGIDCVAANLDRFAQGKPLQNVIRNASDSDTVASAVAAEPAGGGDGKASITGPRGVSVELAGVHELTKLVEGQEIAFHSGGSSTGRFRLVQV